MKTETSALDLHYLVSEAQLLVGAKVDKIYLDKKMILFQLHKTGTGKTLLFCLAPNYFYLISKKPSFPERPGSFCMQLRKNLDQSRIKSIEQIGFERIVKITFSTKEKEFFIYLELFIPGNIVFTNEENKILGLSQSENFADRTLRPGIMYKLPPTKSNTKELELIDFQKIIETTEKESIVKTLAIELSLGGLYAEQICVLAGVGKNLKKINQKQTESLYSALKDLFNQKINARVYNKKEIIPILIEQEGEFTDFETFSSAIDSVITPQFEFKELKKEKEEHNKKVEKTLHIIKEQEKTIKKFENEIIDNHKKGELIYTNYSEINDLLHNFLIDKKKMNSKELKDKYKQIIEINEKDATILVEIKNE